MQAKDSYCSVGSPGKSNSIRFGPQLVHIVLEIWLKKCVHKPRHMGKFCWNPESIYFHTTLTIITLQTFIYYWNITNYNTAPARILINLTAHIHPTGLWNYFWICDKVTHMSFLSQSPIWIRLYSVIITTTFSKPIHTSSYILIYQKWLFLKTGFAHTYTIKEEGV